MPQQIFHDFSARGHRKGRLAAFPKAAQHAVYMCTQSGWFGFLMRRRFSLNLNEYPGNMHHHRIFLSDARGAVKANAFTSRTHQPGKRAPQSRNKSRRAERGSGKGSPSLPGQD